MPAPESKWSGPRAAGAATVAYVLLSILMTWPLATGLASVLPSDHGDNLLNAWILGWGADSVSGMFTGESTFRDWWNAPIFYPSPLALGYSEHLFALVVQSLPIYLVTDNVILSYNLLFLSTFALSGLGVYLLVTDITGSRAAGFVAGLFYAFAPFRITHLSHLQILASQWMPFALYGFRRYLATRRVAPLIGGSSALVAQNLSCGYYLLFFAPIVPTFIVIEMARRGLLRDRRVWLSLAVAALVVAGATLPFLMPYTELRALEGFERSIREIREFSPDLYGYVTAPEALRFWGTRLRVAPRPEGELFPGLVPMVLGFAALGVAFAEARRASHVAPPARRQRCLLRLLAAVVVLAVVALIGLALIGPVRTNVFGIPFRMADGSRASLALLCAAVGLAALSRRARVGAIAFVRSSTVTLWGFLLFAGVMSLGPSPHRGGEPLDGLWIYAIFVDYVPGFDGLRVPGRYAMLAALFLSLVAGMTLAWLARAGRVGLATVCACGVLFLGEAAAIPIDINRVWGIETYRDPPIVKAGPEAPPLYRHLAGLARDQILLEMPIGDPGWDLRAVYYASVHRLRLVNGYSGGFPHNYRQRSADISGFPADPDLAWDAILASGATHLVVHSVAYRGDRSDVLHAFLAEQGAVKERDFGDGEVLYRVPR